VRHEHDAAELRLRFVDVSARRRGDQCVRGKRAGALRVDVALELRDELVLARREDLVVKPAQHVGYPLLRLRHRQR